VPGSRLSSYTSAALALSEDVPPRGGGTGGRGDLAAAARPGRPCGSGAMRSAYLAWVAAMVLFVVCFVIYVRQYLHAYHIVGGMAQPRHAATAEVLADEQAA
jgi:hypothetical protein